MGRAFEYRKAAKMKRWGKMSKIFPKLGKAITLAAKEGGADPEMNAKLRMAIQAAKAQNMPKDNIEAAIKRAAGKDVETMVEVVYEGKGPHGILVIVECATDNTTRTVANVRSYFNKAGGSMVEMGQLEYMFNRQTIVEFKKPEEIDLEELELELIDAGMEEINTDEDTVYVTGGFADYGSLTSKIEEMGFEITKAATERVPTSPIELSEDQMTEVDKMLDKIDEDEDVQEYYTNLG